MADAGEFGRAAVGVAGKGEAAALGVDDLQMIDVNVLPFVFADDEVPARRHGEIVAKIEQQRIARFEEVLEHGRLVSLARLARSEAHTSELPSLMRISYAVFC